MKRKKIALFIIFTLILSTSLGFSAEPAKKISLDIKGMDILDVLKIIAT